MVSSSMRRVRLFASVSAVLLVGGVALASPSDAKRPAPIDGVGSVSCRIVGQLKFDPPLKATTAPVPTTVTLAAMLNQCTGTGDGARVVTGQVKVSGQAPTNDCISLLTAAQQAPRTGLIRWRVQAGSQKLNPTSVTVTDGAHNAGPPITVDGTGSASGSFGGDTSATHTVLRETFDKLRKGCTSRNGLRGIHFNAESSTFSLTAP